MTLNATMESAYWHGENVMALMIVQMGQMNTHSVVSVHDSVAIRVIVPIHIYIINGAV